MLWVNPPFKTATIARTVTRLRHVQARAYLLVPVWTLQPWWHAVSRGTALRDRFLLTPVQGVPLFTSPSRHTDCQILYLDFRA